MTQQRPRGGLSGAVHEMQPPPQVPIMARGRLLTVCTYFQSLVKGSKMALRVLVPVDSNEFAKTLPQYALNWAPSSAAV